MHYSADLVLMYLAEIHRSIMLEKPALSENKGLLRMGAVAFLADLIIIIGSTAFHPSREDPANHPQVLQNMRGMTCG
jgi:hypothetical protein